MARKNLGFLHKYFRFLSFLRFLTYKCRTQNYDPEAKNHHSAVNATNRNSYLNVICIELVSRVKKKSLKKTKIRT